MAPCADSSDAVGALVGLASVLASLPPVLPSCRPEPPGPRLLMPELRRLLLKHITVKKLHFVMATLIPIILTDRIY